MTFAEKGKTCTAPEKAENLKGELVKNACEKVEGVEAIHLPWKTTLATLEEEAWDTIANSGAGQPGYVRTCMTSKIKINDSCEGVAEHPVKVAADNLQADEEAPKLALVDILFLQTTFELNENEWAKCSAGGEHSGLVVGELLLEAFLSGVAVPLLALTELTGAQWLCNGTAVVSKNECLVLGENLEVMLLKDMSAGNEVDCAVGSVLSEGFVGPGAKDETTKVEVMESAKNCVAPELTENLKGELVKNTCEKVEGVEVVHLPWNTLLETIGEKQWDAISASTAESNPAYVVSCMTSKIKFKDSCEGVTEHPLLVAVENLKADEEAPKLPLVDMLFLENTFEKNENEWGSCSVGGPHSALVVSEMLFEASLGGVAVSLEADK